MFRISDQLLHQHHSSGGRAASNKHKYQRKCNHHEANFPSMRVKPESSDLHDVHQYTRE